MVSQRIPCAGNIARVPRVSRERTPKPFLPRKTEDDSESIEALKERVPDKLSGSVDVEDADNPSGFELPGADLSDLELDVVVLPPQEDEFTCSNCFLVKHRSQLDHEGSDGPICSECSA